MLQPGQTHDLKVTQDLRVGLVLARGADEVLLPRREVPDDLKVGDRVRAFVYVDSDDRLSATLARPRGELGDIVAMRVVDVSSVGAFLDWGLGKDLFLPFAEMFSPVRPGDDVVVHVGLCARGRPVASARLARHFDRDTRDFAIGQPVRLLVYAFNDHGALVVVDGRASGMVHRDELVRRVAIGVHLEGWVKDVRPDGRLEVRLRPLGREGAEAAELTLLLAARDAGGALDLHDGSAPDEIRRRLRLSKKAFKQALGGLYRRGLARIEPGGFALTDAGAAAAAEADPK
jgi:uncharacterized protein